MLARKVSEVRTVAEKRLHATVARAAHRADAALPGDLVATLVTPEGARVSELERLRRPPTRTTGTAFARSLERVDEIGAFQLGRVRVSQVLHRQGRPDGTGMAYGGGGDVQFGPQGVDELEAGGVVLERDLAGGAAGRARRGLAGGHGTGW